MGEPAPDTQAFESSSGDRLDSWKEIAAYLKRDVTTVQRWEKREGMPVRRHLHERMGSVHASRADLDAWVRSRNAGAAKDTVNGAAGPALAAAPPSQTAKATSRTKWKVVLLLAAAGALLVGVGLSLRRTEYFWRNPVAGAKFHTVTEFEGLQQAATISRDGHLVAFLSDRDGQMDIWATQVGSGEFHNLTHKRVPELGNPSLRSLGFSPDGSLVTFWARKPGESGGSDISVWAVPVLGGEPRLYMSGVAEFDWAHDGSRLAYHTPGPGDPLFVSNGGIRTGDPPIFTAPPGLHSHFPLWAPDAAFLYFVQGSLPDKLDVWRIRPSGGTPERITSQIGQVSYPVLLDRHTLLYLSSDSEGSGPWLYGMDVDHRVAHRLTTGLDRYTSLAASADGRQLVATRTTTHRTLWRLRIGASTGEATEADPIALTTSTGFSPRLGPNYLLYVSPAGSGESVWKLANGTSSELWHGEGARIFGGPALSPDGQQVAFSVRQQGRTRLYVMQADGTNARVVTDSLELQGGPAWEQDGKSLTTAVSDHGIPQLFRVPVNGRAPSAFVREYSVDPAWAPGGKFVVFSGPDIGTTFSVKAVTDEAKAHALPALTLTRGARHISFLHGGGALVFLRGSLEHKDLWSLDLQTGIERQLTHLPSDFGIADFDISADGREVILERVREHSDVVLLDLPSL